MQGYSHESLCSIKSIEIGCLPKHERNKASSKTQSYLCKLQTKEHHTFYMKSYVTTLLIKHILLAACVEEIKKKCNRTEGPGQTNALGILK